MEKLKIFSALLCLFVPMQLGASELGTLTIVSGSYGGGWELTARATGDTLVSLGLADTFKLETLEGAAGWRAFEMFLTKDKHREDILVQSEPLISGFLKKRYNKGFRDLRPVALIAAEYSCIIVAGDSPYKNLSDILSVIKNTPAKIPILLGGRSGAGDHIVANMIFKAAGIENTTGLRYMFTDGGDNAAIRHLKEKKYIIAISGYNSIITNNLKEKNIRVIGITSLNRIDELRTLKEQGVNIEYANWRGFFARKDIPEEKFYKYLHSLKTLSESSEWKAVLKKNGWNSYFKSGPELDGFLIRHEQNLKSVMQELEIIR